MSANGPCREFGIGCAKVVHPARDEGLRAPRHLVLRQGSICCLQQVPLFAVDIDPLVLVTGDFE